jgi:TonB family protein
MNEATDIIVARSRDVDRLSTMVMWSVAAHVVVTAIVVLVPRPATDLTPKAIMTINLGGASGPRTGMTQMAARPVQAPEPATKRAESAPAPKPPAMTLPDPKSKPQAVKNAPKDAASKTPTTGPELTEGTARSSERKRGQGFAGLSGGGGGDNSGVTLDVTDFCCPDYIIAMKEAIDRNWNENQVRTGVTTMMFTIRSDGRIEGIRVEKPSGFPALDDEAARALRFTRLDPLPRNYPNPTLTVHLRFEYGN